MLHSKGDLTENKLILLELLQCAGCPLSEDTVNVVVTEPGWMYYFDMCQQLMDLEECGFVETRTLGGEPFRTITKEGSDALEQFRTRIPWSIREEIEDYVLEHSQEISSAAHIHAVTEKDEKGRLFVRMSLTGEEQEEIFKMSMETSDFREGSRIAQNFREKGPELYAQLVRSLTRDIE